MTNEQFIKHRLAMRESPAWRHLPDNARRVLDRIEVEHLRHGGAENGKLVVTYADLQHAGIRRASIFRAIQECAALGFLVVIEKGGIKGNHTWSSRYRLTYAAPKKGKPPTPTDDWMQVVNDQMAKDILASIDRPTNGQAQAGAGAGRKSARSVAKTEHRPE